MEKEMKFFLGFISLLFICCNTEKAEKNVLPLCMAGVDSLLRSSQIKYDPIPSGSVNGVGYIDGHCLDSGKSLLLHQEEYVLGNKKFKVFIQVLEYGNFKMGHYAVDSVAVPLSNFKVFKNRQQIALENLDWHSDNPYIENFLGSGRLGLFKSIYPYGDKIFGLVFMSLIAMDVQKKSFERLANYSLYKSVHFESGSILPMLAPLNLISMRNDTLVVSHRQPYDGFIDTLFITLDGKNVVPKVRNDFCLEFSRYDNAGYSVGRKFIGDKEKCTVKY
jgi:hypothetical protein